MGGSCCGGCDLTKAAFPPTNPSLAAWTVAQPPPISLLLLSLSHVCVMRAHPSLSHMHTLHALSWQEFSTKQQENIAASCAVNFSIRLNLKDCLQTAPFFFSFPGFPHVLGYTQSTWCPEHGPCMSASSFIFTANMWLSESATSR